MSKGEPRDLERLMSAWPIHDVLTRLADAADHLLNDHGCDQHGWEGVACARDAARGHAAALRERTPSDPVGEDAIEPLARALVAFAAYAERGEKLSLSEICAIVRDGEIEASAIEAARVVAEEFDVFPALGEPDAWLVEHLNATDSLRRPPFGGCYPSRAAAENVVQVAKAAGFGRACIVPLYRTALRTPRVEGEEAARRMLETCREAIAAQPVEAFGTGRGGEMEWPIRDELVHEITKTLAALRSESGVGEKEPCSACGSIEWAATGYGRCDQCDSDGLWREHKRARAARQSEEGRDG